MNLNKTCDDIMHAKLVTAVAEIELLADDLSQQKVKVLARVAHDVAQFDLRMILEKSRC